MAEKMYKVLEGQRYRGKHVTYYGKGEMGRKEGDVFSGLELFGNADNLEMALEGSDDVMKRFPPIKDEHGKVVQGKEFVAIKGKDPKIKLVQAPAKKGKKK